jgi:hypothetical protein
MGRTAAVLILAALPVFPALFLVCELQDRASEYFMLYYNKQKEDSREERDE